MPLTNWLWLRSSCIFNYSIDDGEFGRTINEELPKPQASIPINSHFRSPGLQMERFCEQPEDKRNSDELCKIEPMHCQGTENYNEHNACRKL